MRSEIYPFILLAVASLVHCNAMAQWKPVDDVLRTRFANDVNPDNVLPEYPRPQLVREQWKSLNGLWEYGIVQRYAQDVEYDGQVLVPYPVESALSGVGRQVGAENALWYRRTFTVPSDWDPLSLIMLHFEAVDWDATVWVDGTKVGEHRGGYDHFSFDVTDVLRDGADDHELVVRVWDPTDAGWQPRGKQVAHPGGIWYTAVTGIWQSVWLEPVPQTHITRLKITPDVQNNRMHFEVETNQGAQRVDDLHVIANIMDGRIVAGRGRAKVGESFSIPIISPKLWSPANPNLYDVQVRLLDSVGNEVDRISTYCALREIAVEKDSNGINRMILNGKPLFQYGPLDQGWWPDGLYTAPTDEALRYDIEVMKQFGFNAVRKHVKREPDRWYYHCDQLGLMVWQDMPSGDRYIGGNDPDIERSAQSRENFYREYGKMIDELYNHPSVVVWVPFNEGWGQFETDEVINWTRERDPTRLVDGPSGWADRGTGDLHDRHQYPGPGMFPIEDHRASVLGEFGGLGLVMHGHLWTEAGNWGYRSFDSTEQLTERYVELVRELRPLLIEGLAGAVYTQLTDVEIEVNGLMTYDRAVIKIDPDRVRPLHESLYDTTGRVETLLSVAQPNHPDEAPVWKYTMARPEGDWFAPSFDDSSWKEGRAGFGTSHTPGSVVNTQWDTADIWLRRGFNLDAIPDGEVLLRIHHDEDATVYLNGREVAKFDGYTTGYTLVPASDAFREALRTGKNMLAVHCHQTAGGQYIDLGLAVLHPDH